MKNKLNETSNKKLYGRLNRTLKFVNNKDIERKDILNIGCGFGWFEANVIDKANSITSTEISEKDLESIRKTIKSNKLRTIVGSAIELPFKNETFDTVVSWEVIEHIPRNTEFKMFKEVNRVLKKGGVFYLSTPFNSIPSKVLDPAWWLLGHRHYSIKQINNFAEQTNFSVNKIFVAGKWWTILEILNLYVSKWILNREIIFKDFFISKSDYEYSKSDGFVNLFACMTKKE